MVHRKISKDAGESGERFRANPLPISASKPQIGLIPTTEKHVTGVEIVRHVRRMTQQIRKGPLHNSHKARISELLQKSTHSMSRPCDPDSDAAGVIDFGEVVGKGEVSGFADAMRIGPGTVRSLLSRATATLRKGITP